MLPYVWASSSPWSQSCWSNIRLSGCGDGNEKVHLGHLDSTAGSGDDHRSNNTPRWLSPLFFFFFSLHNVRVWKIKHQSSVYLRVCVFMCVYKCSIPAFYSPPFLHLPLHNAEGLLCACRRLCDPAVWRRPNHRHWLCFYLSTTKAFIVVLCSLFCWCGHRQRETWLYLHIVDAFTLCEDHCFFSEQHFKADLQSNMYICSYCGAWWPVFMSKCRV